MAHALARRDVVRSDPLIDENGGPRRRRQGARHRAGGADRRVRDRGLGRDRRRRRPPALDIVIADRARRRRVAGRGRAAAAEAAVRQIAAASPSCSAPAPRSASSSTRRPRAALRAQRLFGIAPEALARGARAWSRWHSTDRRATSRCRCSASRQHASVVPWADATIAGFALTRLARRAGAAALGGVDRRAVAARALRAGAARPQVVDAICRRGSRRVVLAVSSRRTMRAGRRTRAARCRCGSDRAGIVGGGAAQLSARRAGGARQRACCSREMHDRPDGDYVSVDRSVQRQAAGEVGELLAQDQPAAVQPRLQRLILHLQHRARFFGRHPLNVAQHHRRAIDRRQRQDRAEHALGAAASEARARRPCSIQSANSRDATARLPSSASVERHCALFVLRPLIAAPCAAATSPR